MCNCLHYGDCRPLRASMQKLDKINRIVRIGNFSLDELAPNGELRSIRATIFFTSTPAHPYILFVTILTFGADKLAYTALRMILGETL
jgi:hypothetical protein